MYNPEYISYMNAQIKKTKQELISEVLVLFTTLELNHYELERKGMNGINPKIMRFLKEERKKWEERNK